MVEVKESYNVANEAVSNFGVTHQLYVVIEELSELQQALTKYLREIDGKESGILSLDNIAEEMADVEISLEQLRYIFGNTEMVSIWRGYKEGRLHNLIFGGSEDGK